LKQLVITDFKLRYKGSALGYLWTLLRPLALFAVLYVVFVNFLRFGADIPHFPIYLLLGVVLWSYFVEVTNNGLTSIVNKGDLMRKLSFPRYVIVIAGSISAVINLAINLLVVLAFMVINGVPLTLMALWLPLIILELFVFSLGLSFLLSALYVRFRDINYVWEVLLQAGFYMTPIIYPLSQVAKISDFAAKAVLLNPVAQIIQGRSVRSHHRQNPDSLLCIFSVLGCTIHYCCCGNNIGSLVFPHDVAEIRGGNLTWQTSP
jgi:ABC-2 type transport system permease protein